MPDVVEVTELPTLKGKDIGTSRWMTVTQDQVYTFATLTGDEQWIHVDEERAKAGPFGSTIAHGFFVLSCSHRAAVRAARGPRRHADPQLRAERARFAAPTPVDSRVRMGLKVTDVTEVSGGYQVTFGLTFQREGQEKPVCVAELLFRYYAPAS